jgi:hypothetical protein
MLMLCGICKLCLEEKELHDSHLIPKGVYKSLRSEEHDATAVTATKILQISLQFHAPLLCLNCEDRLNRGGETWVLKHMARRVPCAQFLLFDLLHDHALCRRDEDGRIYEAGKIPGIDIAKLAHFTLGMVWKTTIHSWRGVDGYKRRLSLGPYAEPVRRFLLGTGPFPAHCYTRILLWPDKESVFYCTHLPRRNIEPQFHLYSYYLPGITFCAYVGKGVPRELRETCCYSSALKPIRTSKLAARINATRFHNVWHYPEHQIW